MISSHRDQHRLGQALSSLTVEVPEAREARERELEPLRGGDMGQMVQCDVSGKVGDKPVWQQFNVMFPNPILLKVGGQGRSDTNLDKPHFAQGIELLTPGHVMIDCQVRGWIENSSQMTTGAILRVSAWAPKARKKKAFSAVLHLTFFGYGAPADNDYNDDEV